MESNLIIKMIKWKSEITTKVEKKGFFIKKLKTFKKLLSIEKTNLFYSTQSLNQIK
jgi:hypothetical protein